MVGGKMCACMYCADRTHTWRPVDGGVKDYSSDGMKRWLGELRVRNCEAVLPKHGRCVPMIVRRGAVYTRSVLVC